MKLDENYTIDSDKYCWILRYKKVGDINPKTNKPTVSTDETFHPTIKSALVRYCDSANKGSETISEVLMRIGELNDRISKLNIK